MADLRILGIDPGTAITGFGIIEVDGQTKRLVDCGVITTPKTMPMSARLAALEHDLIEVIAATKPDVAAVEQLFFATNAKTAISVGQARGVILLVAEKHHLTLAEYTPLQIKQAIAGYGQATKQQIQQMVKLILKLRDVPRPDDAADAVAIALTHAANLDFAALTAQAHSPQKP